MADARVPPLGPPLRDPTAPARLLDAAAELGLRVERAQRHLDGLSHAVEHLALATSTGSSRRSRERPPFVAGESPYASPAAEPANASLLADARAFAIDLAVGGTARDSIREQLRARFGLLDPDAVLAAAAEPPPASPAADA